MKPGGKAPWSSQSDHITFSNTNNNSSQVDHRAFSNITSKFPRLQTPGDFLPRRQIGRAVLIYPLDRVRPTRILARLRPKLLSKSKTRRRVITFFHITMGRRRLADPTWRASAATVPGTATPSDTTTTTTTSITGRRVSRSHCPSVCT